jgi:hypothetical protein
MISRRKYQSDKNLSVVIQYNKKEKAVVVETIIARKGDVISWKATDSHATLFFPDGSVLGETLGNVSRGKEKKLIVTYELPRNRREVKFYYSIYHHRIKDFARGNSSPAIIIKR